MPPPKGAAPVKRTAGTAKRAPAKRAPAKRAPAKRAPAKRAPAKPAATVGLVPRPETRGPRVRVGILWFLLAMAAATAGRWWTATLWAAVAAVSARELVRVWAPVRTSSGDTSMPPGAEWIAAACAGAVTLAAGYGTGLAGAVLLAVTLGSAALALLSGPRSVAMVLPAAAVLPAVAASSVVLAVRVDLWVGLFLIAAVSMYDAGAFVMGAESSSRVEGPVTGIVGALAVTFTMSAFGAPPFDAAAAAATGALVALSCPLGTALVSAVLPSPDTHVRALRRLDAYLVAGPVMVGGAWLVS
jgi:hypothetical protein